MTLCNPSDCSLPGSSVHEFSRQEYWSIHSLVPFSMGSSWPRDWILYCLSHQGSPNSWKTSYRETAGQEEEVWEGDRGGACGHHRVGDHNGTEGAQGVLWWHSRGSTAGRQWQQVKSRGTNTAFENSHTTGPVPRGHQQEDSPPWQTPWSPEIAGPERGEQMPGVATCLPSFLLPRVLPPGISSRVLCRVTMTLAPIFKHNLLCGHDTHTPCVLNLNTAIQKLSAQAHLLDE